MLLDTIKNDERLEKCFKEKCGESGVSANMSSEVNEANYVNINLTQYYKTLRLSSPVATPDCFFLAWCDDETYVLTIIELKSGNFKPRQVEKQFRTCYDDFMSKQFPAYFDRVFKKIDLILVRNLDDDAYKNRAREQLFKVLVNKRFSHNGVTSFIQDKTSPYTISPCI